MMSNHSETIQNVLNMAQDFTNASPPQFLYETISKNFAEIAKLSDAIKSTLALLPSETTEMSRKQLTNLGELLHRLILQENYPTNASALQLITYENDPQIDKASTGGVNCTEIERLYDFMLDCIIDPCEEATEKFRKQYNLHPAWSIAYDVMNKMRKTWNSLIKAINDDPLKSRKTFENCQTFLSSILGQLLFLESFASGLLKSADKLHNSKMVKYRADSLLKDIEVLKSHLEESDTYWQELESKVDEFMKTTEQLSDEKTADELKTILESILTNDAFMILASKADYGWKRTYKKDDLFYGFREEGFSTTSKVHIENPNTIIEKRYGGRIVAICRIRNGKLLSKEAITRGPIEMIELNGRRKYLLLSKEFYKDHTPDSGNLISAYPDLKPHWRHVNWLIDDIGPGHFMNVKVEDYLDFRSGMYQLFCSLR